MSLSDSGGALTLSPKHAHHVNISSAVRGLRRSISRSPSRFNLSSQSNTKSTSPQSPLRRYSPIFSPYQAHAQMSSRDSSPRASQSCLNLASSTRTPSNATRTPANSIFKSGSKLSLRSSRLVRNQGSGSPSSPSSPSVRPRAPKSPLKRALNATSDTANSTTPTSTPPTYGPGQENKPEFAVPTSPLSRRCTNKPSRHSLHLDVSGASQSMFKGPDATAASSTPVSASTLKRSDANLDFGAERATSPVAKRRSLHGVSSFSNLHQDAHVFEHASSTNPLNFEIHDDSNQEYQLTGSPAAFIRRDTQPSPTPPSVTRRSSSLRKSTLQQRHGDKSSWGRRAGAQLLAQMGKSDASSPIGRNRPRISLDQFVPPAPRDSPSSSTGPPPPPSMPPLPQQAPHPLSRSIRASSSSGNNVQEDTPMKFTEPSVHSAPSRTADPFRFSLGPGAVPFGVPANEPPKSQTPRGPLGNSRSGMFMSSGLVSKVNRDPEDDRPMVVPDTPCKKNSSFGYATYPPPPGSAVRYGRSPASPIFHAGPPNFGEDAFGNYGNAGRSLGLFHRVGNRPHRRASVLDLNAEYEASAVKASDGHTTPDEMPPTPTRLFSTPTAVTSTPTDGDGRDAVLDSPSANRRLLPISAVKSYNPREQSPSPIRRRQTPKTPQGPGTFTLDPSRLSISNSSDAADDEISVPVTPTTSLDRRLVTPVHAFSRSRVEADEYLLHRFARVDEVGQGEFSTVYRVAYPKKKRASLGLEFGGSRSRTPPGSPPPGTAFAIKKSRRPFQGARDRLTKLKEIRILKALSSANHILHYVNSWEIDAHLYIQTEYCDEGTLGKFLSDIGRQSRLDDFRIWKIIHDLSLGLQEIHHAGFIHLDLKPANIFITFEGVLKIGDFGLATEWPVAAGVDAEGDRFYIGPEVLNGQVGKPADIFSLGLIVLEIAANVQLPENGPSWQALRNGDFRDVPSLTTCATVDTSPPATRVPTSFEEAITGVASPAVTAPDFGTPKHAPLAQPPGFMADAAHPYSLDHLVRQMAQPEPSKRPTIDDMLQLESVRWVAARRRCAATVFEGTWGPEHVVSPLSGSDYDTEMTDV